MAWMEKDNILLESGPENSKHIVRLTVEPKVLTLVRARFLWPFPYLERMQGALGWVPRGPVGPQDPLSYQPCRAQEVLSGHTALAASEKCVKLARKMQVGPCMPVCIH
jgi:hypothetical protein